MNSKQTWSLTDSYCQFEAKFRILMIEDTLSATNFRFVAKIHRKSVLCSDEMSLNRPWTFDRIFVRTFDERSLEQITKFAEFRLHYFCIILYITYIYVCRYITYIYVCRYITYIYVCRYITYIFACRYITYLYVCTKQPLSSGTPFSPFRYNKDMLGCHVLLSDDR